MLDTFSPIENLDHKKPKSQDGAAKVQRTLGDVNRLFEEQEAAQKAVELGYEYANLKGFPFDLEALGLITVNDAKAAQTIPFFHESGVVRVGIIDPDLPAVAEVRRKLEKQKYEVRLYIISKSSLEDGLQAYTRVVTPALTGIDYSKLTDAQKTKYAEVFAKNLSRGEEFFEKTDASELLVMLLSYALSLEASDIHLEPSKEQYFVRLRIDGVLQEVAQIPHISFRKLLSRLKIISHLKLNSTNKPQDGSFSVMIGKNQIDFRIALLPSIYDETVVIRILQQSYSVNLQDLGVRGKALERLRQAAGKTSGMVLTTGPTGSGKTTTLYAVIKEIQKPGLKIITIEDPVEYKVEGISQTSVDKNSGLTFATALRSVLRQDPDIIMVGEIRDHETAETAIQSALTGHLVLSTLHTNDAPSTIARLIDLEIKPFLIVGAINVIMAQRLVRRLCEFCKHEDILDPNIAAKVEAVLSTIPSTAGVVAPETKTFYTGKGCDKCGGLGYKGRMGIYEVLAITPELEKLVLRESPLSALRQQAIADGMLTMVQDGLLKALEGTTDVYEIFRVID